MCLGEKCRAKLEWEPVGLCPMEGACARDKDGEKADPTKRELSPFVAAAKREMKKCENAGKVDCSWR